MLEGVVSCIGGEGPPADVGSVAAAAGAGVGADVGMAGATGVAAVGALRGSDMAKAEMAAEAQSPRK